MEHKNNLHFGLSYSTDFHRVLTTCRVLQEEKDPAGDLSPGGRCPPVGTLSPMHYA